MAPKAQVETTPTNNGEIQSPTIHDKFAEYMALRAQANERDTSDAMNTISGNVLAAQTVDELWEADEGNMPGGDDVVGIEQRIFSFDIIASTDESKKNPRTGNTYLIVHAARLDNGKEFDWNTSATLIVQKLMRLEQLDAINPVDGHYVDCVVTSITTGSGNEVLKLRPVRQRAI